MTKRTGGSTNAAPSALQPQAQSETGDLPKVQAGQAPSTTTEPASQPASTVTTSPVKPETPDVVSAGNTNNTGLKDQSAPALESKPSATDSPDKKSDDQSGTGGDVEKSNDSDGDQSGANADQQDPAADSNSSADVNLSDPALEGWDLRVRNLTACRFYEPFSKVHLEPHQVTQINSGTLKTHQQVKANIQELARLKKGKLEIIND